MKTKVMNFIGTVRFRNRGEAYAFLDAVQEEMESTGKDVSLLHLCTYLTIGRLPDDISVEDCKKYVWTNTDFNDALVFTGKKDWFSSYGILLPECKEADIDETKVLY